MTTTPAKEDDVQSIASDFSIIPESLALEDCNTSVVSEDLRPSLQAEMAYGKVKFIDIQSTYTTDTDIAVSFILKSGLVPKSSDRVGLFKVGFQAPQEYLSYQWVTNIKRSNIDDQLPYTVVFKASNLPKDMNEFYQFCYVTHHSQIVGVSQSFQLQPFGSLRPGDVCDDKEEGGLVVVTSQESTLHTIINELKMKNSELRGELQEAQVDVTEARSLLEEKTKLLAQSDTTNKTLESKLEREVATNHDLNNRLSQVLEERGNLEERVSVLEKQLTAAKSFNKEVESQLDQYKNRNIELEVNLDEVTRKKEETTVTLSGMTAKLNSLTEANKNLSDKISTYIAERDRAVQDLETWTSGASSEREDRSSLQEKCRKANKELNKKIEQIDLKDKVNLQLENSLINASEKMHCLKIELCHTKRSKEEQKKEFEERQEVVNRDNEELKTRVSRLQQDLNVAKENELEHMEYRNAAEKVASDMSKRLLTSKSEYQNLALLNLKLTKKLKKLRKSQSSSMVPMSSEMMSFEPTEWLEMDPDLVKNEQLGPDLDMNEGSLSAVAFPLPCMSNSSVSNSCTQTAQKLSKMEQSVIQLTTQVESLKVALKAAQSSSTQTDEAVALTEATTNNNDDNETQVEATQQVKDEPSSSSVEITNADIETQTSPTVEEQPVLIQTQAAVAVPPGEQKVIYSNSFLPSQRTAPVFLPETSPARDVSNKEATSQSLQSHSSAPMIYPQISLTQSQQTAPLELALPPPLKPEATPSARHVAVMHKVQTAHNSSQQPQQQESDDDDYHSTGDSGEHTPPVATAPKEPEPVQTIQCPICCLSFSPSAMTLLQAHMESHLEHVCPMCSQAFPNNSQKKYEEHVYAHFDDENEEEPADPTGPWSYVSKTALFEID